MGVKKPVKKKAAKKKAKPQIKTAVSSDFYSMEVWNGSVKCPYCKQHNSINDEDELPESLECYHCDKKFKVKWE